MSATASSTSALQSTPSTSSTLALATSTATTDQSSSSLTNPFFTSFPSSTSTSSSNDNPTTNLATSSSLYLFTFLATLLLLLAISCAIVIRSFVIRRRFHRRVHEMLAEGLILPQDLNELGGMGAGMAGVLGGGGRRREWIGEKPKMWDAHLAPPRGVGVSRESKWDDLMPVSVKILSDKLTGAGQEREPSGPPTRPRSTFLHSASFGNWRPRFFRSSNPSPSSTSPDNANANANANGGAGADAPASSDGSPSSPEDVNVIDDAKLQVSVLIAMPSPYRPRAWAAYSDHPHGHGYREGEGESESRDGHGHGEGEGEEDELPEVVLGTTEVPWKVSLPVQPSEATDRDNEQNTR